MEELLVKDQVVKTIDSREVAEMLEKEHKYILRDIEGTDKVVGIIPTLESANLHYQDYFIESTYKSGTREYKCYLCTKMGCELLGNKQQGEKGILFTAKYVKRFNDMENQISDPVQNYLSMCEEDRAILYFTKLKESKQLESENKEKDKLLLIAGEKTTIVDEFLDSKGLYGVDSVAKTLGIKGMGRNNLYEYLRDNKIIMTDTYLDKHNKKKAGAKHYEAYSQYVNTQQYFAHRSRTVQMGFKNIEQLVAMFTPKGIQWIIKRLQKDGYIATKDLQSIISELSKEPIAS